MMWPPILSFVIPSSAEAPWSNHLPRDRPSYATPAKEPFGKSSSRRLDHQCFDSHSKYVDAFLSAFTPRSRFTLSKVEKMYFSKMLTRLGSGDKRKFEVSAEW